MNLQRINQINEIIFTQREIDVIACIINVRGVKKIGDILGISHRTVEGYIKTILRKVSSNSQEGIKDFVEKSPQLVLLKQHYIDLLINKLFLAQISKVAIKLKNKNISCIVKQEEGEELEYIISSLKLSNVNIIFTEKATKVLINKNNQKIIVALSERHLIEIKDGEADNIIFVCFNKKLSDDFLQKFPYVQTIECFEKDHIYSAIFRIIELLVPNNIDLNDLILNFNKQKDNVVNLKNDLIAKSLNVSQETKEQIITKGAIKITPLLSSVIIGIILLIGVLIYKNYSPTTNININFSLPNKKTLLERTAITSQLDKIFAKPNNINIVILSGVTGSGKTTIARNYANKQKASVIWEVNAETKNSLFVSLENFAYALCNNNGDKEELRDILDTKDFFDKNKKLLSFTRRQLKILSNWFIIYNNVESLKDIAEYLPHNQQNWGSGKLIITTKDNQIKNNSYIDNQNIINVDMISKKEKLELFRTIMGTSAAQLIFNHAKMEQFLENIPSFPLDVSMVAHYLKDTGASYNQYLSEIKALKKESSRLRLPVLQDANTHSKIRYDIISLTLRNIMSSNSEFLDLILLIGLLDFQDIPKELLVLCKNQSITNDFLRKLNGNSLISNIHYKDNNKKDINNISSFSLQRSVQTNILTDIIMSLTPSQRQEVLSAILSNIQSYITKQMELGNVRLLKNFIVHCESLLSKEDLLTKDDIVAINKVLRNIYYYLATNQQPKSD